MTNRLHFHCYLHRAPSSINDLAAQPKVSPRVEQAQHIKSAHISDRVGMYNPESVPVNRSSDDIETSLGHLSKCGDFRSEHVFIRD